jgi:hypothetical protein
MNRRGFFAAVAGLMTAAVSRPKPKSSGFYVYPNGSEYNPKRNPNPDLVITFSRNPKNFKAAKYTQYRARPKCGSTSPAST